MKKILSLFVVMILVPLPLLLEGCGDGSSQPTVSGVAAAGSPVSGRVYLKDSSTPPREVSTPIAADGSFSVDVGRLTPPFMLKAAGTVNGIPATLYSFSPSGGFANVNPLTHLAVVQAVGSDDLAALYDGGTPTRMREIMAALPTAVATVRNVFQPTLQQFGVGHVDFLSGRYVANHQGLDLLLDTVDITAAGGFITVADRSGSTTRLPLAGFETGSVNVAVPADGTVMIFPRFASVGTGRNFQFTALVVGTAQRQVTWTVVEEGGGSITEDGLYTPPAVSGTYHLKATNTADPSRSATATVSVYSTDGGSTTVPPTSGVPPVPPPPPISQIPPTQYKGARLKLSGFAPPPLTGTAGSVGKLLSLQAQPVPYGISVGIQVPPGVTVTDVVPSRIGLADQVSASVNYNFSRLSSGAGALQIAFVQPTGIQPDEFLAVDCTIATGFYPDSALFLVSEYTAVDSNGAAIVPAPYPYLDIAFY